MRYANMRYADMRYVNMRYTGGNWAQGPEEPGNFWVGGTGGPRNPDRYCFRTIRTPKASLGVERIGEIGAPWPPRPLLHIPGTPIQTSKGIYKINKGQKS